MKRILFPVICILLISSIAIAQDFPRVEIFGGYNIHRHGINDFDDITAEDINDIIGEEDVEVNSFSTNRYLKKGFMASATFNLNSFFGIEAAFKYNKDKIVNMNLTIDDVETITADGFIKYSDLSFLAGPRFAFRKSEVITPFAHVLIGLDSINLSAGAEAVGEEAELDIQSDSGFGFAFGGGLDINVADFMAIRAIQADYYITNHYEETLNNLDLSFGAVFFFGK